MPAGMGGSDDDGGGGASRAAAREEQEDGEVGAQEQAQNENIRLKS